MQTLKLSINKILVMMYSVFYKEGGPHPAQSGADL